MDKSHLHYFLPQTLRQELGKPMGELIAGTVEETIPTLREKLIPHQNLLVGVGDVTAEIFVEQGFNPDIIITDGQTKRSKLEEWKDWNGFEVVTAKCPPAEITPEAWIVLLNAIEMTNMGKKVHIKIEGEEDLLVLPLLVELPLGSIVVYGQPNTGAVIREVTTVAKDYAQSILDQMDRK